MADTKITALTASSGLAAADLIAVVDDVAGTPATQKATFTQVLAFIEANATAFAAKDLGPNAQTGTSYTLVLGDASQVVTMNNASANTLTIPTNASVAFAIGTCVNVIQLGAGTTSVAGDTGVTLNGVSAGSGDINNQYQGVSLLKIGTDTWVASGDIGAVA